MIRIPYTPKAERLTIDRLNDNGCLNLLKAFLKNLSREYVAVYLQYRRTPRDKAVRAQYKYLRGIFLSEHFLNLTHLDGSKIVEALERSCV